MSALWLLSGVAAYLGLLGVLALSMTLAGRQVARWVGVPRFRWFQEPLVATSWWRLLAARSAAAVAPLFVAIALSSLGVLVGGIPRVTTRVEVLAGPAREAGMKDGDRILSVDGARVATWEEMRAAVQRAHGPTPIVVERGASQLELKVTPRAGKISVGTATEFEKPSLGAALELGVKQPFSVVSSAAREFWRLAGRHTEPQLAGPVAVVQTTGSSARDGSLLSLLATLAAYIWPFVAGIPFFDAATSLVFNTAHPRARGSELRGYRLERLRLSLLLAASGYVSFGFAYALTMGGLPAALLLVLWSMPAVTSMYPLIWIAGSEVWSRSSVVLALGIALFAPCLPLLIIFGLLATLSPALRNEGFRVRWFRAEPDPDR